jgi:hypothetical protein
VGYLFFARSYVYDPLDPNYTGWAEPLRIFYPLQTLFYAVHHLVAPFVVLPLALYLGDRGRIVAAIALWCLGLFWSPLTMVGVGVLLLPVILGGSPRKWLKLSTLGLLAGIVFPIAVYYSTKIYPEKPLFLWGNGLFVRYYLPFLFLEFAVWFAFLKSDYYKDKRVFLSLAAFIILSFWTIGQSFDWLFRTSVPLLLFICGMVIKSVFESPNLIRVTAFACVYLLGSIPNLMLLQEHFVDKTAPPLSADCRRFSNAYILQFNSTSRQFIGDSQKNILSTLLLAPPKNLLPFGQSWDEALLEKFTPAWDICEDKNSRGGFYYECHGLSELFLLCPYDTAEGELLFHLENPGKSPIVIFWYKGIPRNPLLLWRFQTALERLRSGVLDIKMRPVACSVARFDLQLKLQVPPGGMDVRVPFSIARGVTDFCLVRKNIGDTPYRISGLHLSLHSHGPYKKLNP